jgi:zinc protease
MSVESKREALLREINARTPAARLEHEGSLGFGALLRVEIFRLGNGLRLLLCEDHSAPVLAYHTWYRVGSRHEREGKTGLAHLFEHLMFNEVEGMAHGELDRRIEEAGGETNASTWLDWTHYTIMLPADRLDLAIDIESRRMSRLVLQDPQVTSEREVAANERRYRVEDDVEGAVSEVLWANAYQKHTYRTPTIGWMQDILGLTTADCLEFYKTYYAPNNATVVVTGDASEASVLPLFAAAYGPIPSSQVPAEDTWPEPPQTAERRLELTKPTKSEKLAIGYHAPAFGDADHLAVTLLGEVLFGGRASRVHRRLVRDLEVASEVRVFVGPFRDPGLFEVSATARTGHDADAVLAALDEELGRMHTELVSEEELERARARVELGLLASLETVDGKASTLGFYDTLLGRATAAFERLEALRRLTASDLRRAARRVLRNEQRTVVIVRASPSDGDSEEDSVDGSEMEEPS